MRKSAGQAAISILQIRHPATRVERRVFSGVEQLGDTLLILDFGV